MSLNPQEVLGESVTKLLSDKLYDKRKQAALEIEEKVKEALRSGPRHTQVQRILDCLRLDYIESAQPNYRKGGLIGLASVAIGLESKIPQFLSQLMVPVLDLFKDEDARVRYYACEALYNISKVANAAVFSHFNDIFDGLCKLYADVDSEVKNGVQLLDRLMKDIVTLNASKFRVVEFIPLLTQRMHAKNPFIRQLVLAWIHLLLKVPELDMIWFLPNYLDGLFNMLGDQSRDIRHNADACLNELLKGVISSPQDKALQVIADTAGIVVKCCSATDNCARLSALCWLYEFVNLQMETTRKASSPPTDTWVALLPDLLGGTLHCIDDTEEEITRMAVEMNSGLLEMVQNLSTDIPVDKLVDQLLTSMRQKESMVVRTACLQWICMLLQQSPGQMLRRGTLHRLFEPIFDTLLHSDDEVVMAALRVLAQIMEGRSAEEDALVHDEEEGKDLFTIVTHRLLQLFRSDRKMLESRGRLMIRQLCGHLDARLFYVTVARTIQQQSDQEFAQQLVQTFSWILLTAKETKGLREELLMTAPLTDATTTPLGGRDAAGVEGGTPLFLELLVPWFHNPVSALALCLWAQQYELATEITARFATFEPTLDMLKQLDQLVHLLESPVFSRLRLRLLEPQRHPALLKCLLGLAMLLPQAGAFNILRERIQVVQSGLLLEAQRDSGTAVAGGRTSWWPQPQGKTGVAESDMGILLEQFDAVTARVRG